MVVVSVVDGVVVTHISVLGKHVSSSRPGRKGIQYVLGTCIQGPNVPNPQP